MGESARHAGQAAGGGAGVHPGQFEGDQRQREVLRPLDEAALLRVHEDAGDAGFVEGLQQRLLSGVHSWVLRAPAATRRATGPRATARADCTSICRS